MTEKISMIRVDCPVCGIIFRLPDNFVNARRTTNSPFSCPNKHDVMFVGDTAHELKAKLQSSSREVGKLKTENLRLRHDLEQIETRLVATTPSEL